MCNAYSAGRLLRGLLGDPNPLRRRRILFMVAAVNYDYSLHLSHFCRRPLPHLPYPSLTGLSDASKMTLTHQGGPMTEGEIAAFKSSPHFEATVRMRGWDEAAKDPVAQTPALGEFEALCLAYLKKAAKK